MTSLNFRCASTDGYGDRDDIVLERDRMWDNRQQNPDWRDTVSYDWGEEGKSTHICDTVSYDWGEEGKSTHIYEIVKQMILNDTMRVLRYKNDVLFPEKNDYGDDYSIHDAVNEACIDLGLSDDDYSPGMNIKGYEVDIYLQ